MASQELYADPHNVPEGFTSRREPEDKGGSWYWRCEHCGFECVSWSADVLSSPQFHRADCDNPLAVGDL